MTVSSYYSWKTCRRSLGFNSSAAFAFSVLIPRSKTPIRAASTARLGGRTWTTN